MKFDTNVFFTSDPHFYHNSILKYGRGESFSNVEEMNEKLISNWNEVVPKDGIVFVLGDFALCSKTKIHEILDRLNGKIYLILGNHDDKSYFKHPKVVFVDNYLRIKIEDNDIILSHYPFRSWEKRQYGAWNLHGHCHNTLDQDGSKQMDCCVENGKRYKPFSYFEIKEFMKDKVNLKVDHHSRRNTFYNRLKNVLKYLFYGHI